MALKNQLEPDPLVTLTKEAKEHIEAMKVELDKADVNIKGLESLGQDMSKLKSMVDWGRRAREVILKSL